MSDHSAIEWTDATWNPTTGCSKVSPGCAHCYIERTPAFRIKGRRFVNGATDLRLHYDRLDQPRHWRKPRRVFVNSLSDLFHPDVPFDFVDAVMVEIAHAVHCDFQLLTKRADRMLAYFSDPRLRDRIDRVGLVRNPVIGRRGKIPPTLVRSWPFGNLWLGVSVENQHFADERIPLLLQTPAAVRFISAEPLLEAVDIGMSAATCSCCPRWSSRWVNVSRLVTADFPMVLSPECAGRVVTPRLHRADSNKHGALSVNGIGLRPAEFTALPPLSWVIVGGESGPKARPMDLAWARSIVAQCKAAGVAVFMKQLGAKPVVSTTSSDLGFYGAYDPSLRLRDRKGGEMSEWPDDLKIREFPEVWGS